MTRTSASLIVRIPVALVLAAVSAAAQVPVAAQVVTEDRYPERRTNFPGGVVGLADLTYATIPGYRPLTLDLYLPPAGAGGSTRPFIVYIHGGGWMGGSPRTTASFENWPAVLASIAARGYVVASIHYRFSSEARFPAQIQDVKSAIRWLRTRAAVYGIDKSRGLAWGPSAGGHLAALAATSCGVEALEPAAPRASAADPNPKESDCVQALVAWYGIFDFSTANAPSNLFGCERSECPPDLIRSASPVTFIDPGDPPALIIHGEADRTVPVKQSQEFHRLLREKGVASELLVIPGVNHSFIGADPQATAAAANAALRKTLEFIDATIGPTRALTDPAGRSRPREANQ